MQSVHSRIGSEGGGGATARPAPPPWIRHWRVPLSYTFAHRGSVPLGRLHCSKCLPGRLYWHRSSGGELSTGSHLTGHRDSTITSDNCAATWWTQRTQYSSCVHMIRIWIQEPTPHRDREADHHQNLTSCSLGDAIGLRSISCKFVRKFLSNLTDRQTDGPALLCLTSTLACVLKPMPWHSKSNPWCWLRNLSPWW